MINQFLKDNADKVEDFGYFKKFDPSELELMKDKKIQNDIEINVVKDKIKVIKDAEMKPLEKENKELLESIKTGGQHVTEECYITYNHDSGLAEYVNNDGEMVYSRRLTPEEKQLKLSINKAV